MEDRQVYVVINPKGGCGKTLFATQILIPYLFLRNANEEGWLEQKPIYAQFVHPTVNYMPLSNSTICSELISLKNGKYYLLTENTRISESLEKCKESTIYARSALKKVAGNQKLVIDVSGNQLSYEFIPHLETFRPTQIFIPTTRDLESQEAAEKIYTEIRKKYEPRVHVNFVFNGSEVDLRDKVYEFEDQFAPLLQDRVGLYPEHNRWGILKKLKKQDPDLSEVEFWLPYLSFLPQIQNLGLTALELGFYEHCMERDHSKILDDLKQYHSDDLDFLELQKKEKILDYKIKFSRHCQYIFLYTFDRLCENLDWLTDCSTKTRNIIYHPKLRLCLEKMSIKTAKDIGQDPSKTANPAEPSPITA